MVTIIEIETRLNAIYTRMFELRKLIDPLQEEYQKLQIEAGDLDEEAQFFTNEQREKATIEYYKKK